MQVSKNTQRVTIRQAQALGWLPPASRGQAGSAAGKRDLEGDSQTTLIDLFRLSYPDMGEYLIHIPNGGNRNRFEAYRLKRQGVRKGVSDLLFARERGGYFGLWIEYKAEGPDGAAVSKDQKLWIEMMLGEGYKALVCRGVDEAMKALEEYMALERTWIALPPCL